MTTEEKRARKAQNRMEVFILAAMLVLTLLSLGIILGYWLAYEEPQPAETAAADPAEVIEPVETEAPAVESLGDFKITYYCPCERCCGSHADGITATGTKVTEGRTIGVDPDVIPYGSQVLIRYEDGTESIYTAEDTGGGIRGNHIDIYMDSHADALAEGVKTAEVYMIGGTI